MPPVGETPGWSKRWWINFEASHANIWNNQFDMTRTDNGKILTYKSDFEQTSVVTDFGVALTERFALGFEAPFAARGGGILDDFIDQFHMLIGSDRFLRDLTPDFGKSFVAKTDSVDEFRNLSWTAVGNLKLKAKYWLLKWQGSRNGSCDCGFAVSTQWKIPIANPRGGFTSGHHDHSLLLHLGAPLFQESGVWITAGFTKLGGNEILNQWPMNTWAQMYELAFDIGITKSWGIILQARTESPILQKGLLDYNYTVSTPNAKIEYRIASGWNSLVLWRSIESFGLRWRSQEGHQINLLMLEDWGLGGYDERGDNLYSNNAPDVAFMTQFHFAF